MEKQAKDVLIQGEKDRELNKIRCNFEKKPGNVYYHYRKISGDFFLSVLSPSDWGANCSHEFLGGIKIRNIK